MQNSKKILERKKIDRFISHKKAISHTILPNLPKNEIENEFKKEEVKKIKKFSFHSIFYFSLIFFFLFLLVH